MLGRVAGGRSAASWAPSVARRFEERGQIKSGEQLRSDSVSGEQLIRTNGRRQHYRRSRGIAGVGLPSGHWGASPNAEDSKNADKGERSERRKVRTPWERGRGERDPDERGVEGGRRYRKVGLRREREREERGEDRRNRERRDQ